MTTRSAPTVERVASREPGGAPARVVLDTNAVLDWLVFGDAAARAVGAEIDAGSVAWLATPRILTELHAVLARPLPPHWEQARKLALTIKVERWITLCAEPAPDRRLLCRDATDQVFIDLAREHGPALLLTRDRALLALRRRASAFGVRIETAAAWAAGLAARPLR